MQHKYHRQGCVTMKQNVEDRAAMLGEYIVENKATVRRAAKQFGVSKSTVHKDDGVIMGIEFQGRQKAPV